MRETPLQIRQSDYIKELAKIERRSEAVILRDSNNPERAGDVIWHRKRLEATKALLRIVRGYEYE